MEQLDEMRILFVDQHQLKLYSNICILILSLKSEDSHQNQTDMKIFINKIVYL